MQKPIAVCKDGMVSGTAIQLKGNNVKPVYCFRNIPFAKAPIGQLRFKEPVPVEPWEGVRNGSIIGNIPLQNIESPKAEEPYFPQKSPPGEDEDMNGDCLHLSVYTTTIGEKAEMAVMVWIYGGSFQDGSERLYDGSALAGMNDVVVVIPNYRLNVFGFLSLGKESVCPGNAGLWDQRMALKWVRRNIRSFGGDPDKVTIFGESAGAMSVNHLVNSPSCRDLFHRAISHSGQANVSEFFLSDATLPTKLLLKHLEIEDADPNVILQKLQKLPAGQLKLASEAILEETSFQVKFVPCVDGKLLLKTAEQCLEEKDFAKVPYMIGINNSECRGGMAVGMCGDKYVTGISEKKFKKSCYFTFKDEDLKEWKSLYIGGNEEKTALSKLYGHVTGDKLFVVPALTTASSHADSNDIYMYLCCYQPRFSHDKKFGPKEGMKAPWCYCDHGDDVYVMMGVPFTPGDLQLGGRFSSEEEDLSRKCMTYITNFAKHGDPNIGNNVDATWPKYGKNGNYIIIDHTFDVGSNLAQKEVEYWTKYEERKKN